MAFYTGTCYKGTSMVEVLRDGAAKPLALSAVEKGDLVRVSGAGGHARAGYAKVLDLPRSQSKGTFVSIEVSAAHDKAEAEGLQAVVTPHHTFPSCSGNAVAAKDLKMGDCVVTIHGRRKVRKVDEVAALPGDETFSINLDGAVDVLALGGIYTHANPVAHQEIIERKAALSKNVKRLISHSASSSKKAKIFTEKHALRTKALRGAE